MEIAFEISKKEQRNEWFILLIIFLSRLPFLNNGYGAEEDAWGLAVNARNIANSGTYLASRFPGHPLQEIIYSLIWNKGAFVFNLITAILSTAGIGFFIAAFRKLNLSQGLIAGIILAFIPVIYINSVNDMDYTWAMCFIMVSFYFLIKKNPIAAGVFIGLAVGCRITSGAMLLPFCLWLYNKNEIKTSVIEISKLIIITLLISLICYVPVMSTYGMNFLNYADQFEAPFSKALFRCTIGVWGALAFSDLLMGIFVIVSRSNKIYWRKIFSDEIKQKLFFLCGTVIIIYSIAFIAEPHKAAYLIPAIPFAIILLNILLNKIYFVAFSFSVILSSFFLGVNLNDDLRGATPSTWSYNLKISGQNVSVDFLRGPVIADMTKRRNKIIFSENVAEKLKTINKKTVLISGFWMNDILAKSDSIPSNILLVYYKDENYLRAKFDEGYEIYYLPEQGYFNDLCFKKTFTKKFAKSF